MTATAEAIIRHDRGEVVSPHPGQLLFQHPPGDCHIKYGYFREGPVFVIKVATGFYENPARGPATNDGLVLVFDAATGKTKAILQDEGWLTSWRTAAAGALAAKAGAPSRVTRIGIVGAGHQAELLAMWTAATMNVSRVTIWGRSPVAGERLAAHLRHNGLDADTADTVDELFGRCNVVITWTPSTGAIVSCGAVQPGTHLVAVGADGPGKQELDPLLFGRAAAIVTDDHAQCVDHGDYHYAVRGGIVPIDADVSLGKVLAGKVPARHTDGDITIVDLTGLAAQDVAIASLAVERLEAARTGTASPVPPKHYSDSRARFGSTGSSPGFVVPGVIGRILVHLQRMFASQ